MQKKQLTLIFDFDGTIVDNFDKVIEFLNRFSDEFGYKKLDPQRKGELRSRKMRDVLKKIGITKFKLPRVVRKMVAELRNHIDECKVQAGIKEILSALKSRYQLAILTSNSLENVDRFLKLNNLEFFDFIHTGTSVFGKDRVIKKLLKEKGLQKDQVILIGDETRDIEAARKVGISVVAVCWGYNSKDILAAEEPDFLANNPEDLAGIIDGLQNRQF